jgi:hypothetical protein
MGVIDLQHHLFDENIQPHLINPKNIHDYLSYVHILTSNTFLHECTFGDSKLESLHLGKSILFNSKYISCCVPSPQLEFILESQGIYEYEAELKGFSHSICSRSIDGVDYISDVYSPYIKGEHFNPYVRYKSSIAAASRTCRHLFNLAGLDFPDMSLADPQPNIFLDVVCTFPFEISVLLVDSKYRSRAEYKVSKNNKRTSKKDIRVYHLIDRMDKCRSTFFKKLNDFISWSPEHHAGMSSSLHVWSSSIPILPHAHIHNIIPFFSYHKNVVRVPFFDEADITFFDYYDEAASLASLIVDVAAGPAALAASSPDADIAIKRVDSGSVRVTKSASYGSLGGKSTHNMDVPCTHRYVVDKDKYKFLKGEISRILKDSLGFRGCEWFTPKMPIDAVYIKKLWADVVRDEFKEFLFDEDAVFDVHLEYVRSYDKSKLQHKLKYKSRPPVLDLDLFFKKIDGDFVNSYDTLNFDVVFDFLYYELDVAVKCSNYNDICRYESYIDKLKFIVEKYSIKDVYSWLQFLSIWVTDTRVYGFWRSLKNYVLDPLNEILVIEDVCPVCDGSIVDLGSEFRVDSCAVDFILVQYNSRFFVYNGNSLDGG